ncbi:MAG TPA: hypothetical protein DCL77_16955 [Prolixibacteraceae bacterium]|jgi:hypothetical protein|nr:hypothetical protein [Prolixibacteraceae bacterium]
MNPQSFWKKYEFTDNQTLQFRAGFADVLVKHFTNGWLIKSYIHDQPSEDLEVEEIEGIANDSEVFHFQTGKSNVLIVVPAFPQKAVVFRNNKNIKISAGESANLYFRIPLVMQFYFHEVKDENKLFEIPMQRLSDTWFGDPDNGEPAFSIGNNYDTEFAQVNALSWEAVSAVEIINNTTGVFELQRLILRVEDFSLYLKSKQLLSNHVSIEFKGPEHAGSVNLSVKKEIHGLKPLQLAKARNTVARNLLRKSFFFIKNIYQS